MQQKDHEPTDLSALSRSTPHVSQDDGEKKRTIKRSSKPKVIDEVEAHLKEEDEWLDNLDHAEQEELSDEDANAEQKVASSWTPVNA
ncbi:hypothetical protein MMC10_010894 [Thelotrema lepadinum]|nr:hypothetical protein [Thelotrema lepadinum]